MLTLAQNAHAYEGAKESTKKGDTQMTRGYLTDLIGGLTGPLGMIGSQVFGTSPEDLQVLREAEQARKASKGIAPPTMQR